MKIVTWNCNGALRKKFENLLALDADIYIIPECENPAESSDKSYQDWAINHLWIGDTKNKGLGIFAKPETELVKLNWSNKFDDHTVKHFLPCNVNNDFDLLAVWTHKNNSPNFGYIGQLWKYLEINKEKLGRTIIAGDFNSNSIWDQWDRWWNHSDVVNGLKKLEIESLYHWFMDEKQGAESKSTFFLQRNISKSFHIDYIFVSKKLIKQKRIFEIGSPEKWLHLSDHMPIISEF